jgi:T3SS (YopN, CesT) and YbjN peptide-binding chaperone 2
VPHSEAQDQEYIFKIGADDFLAEPIKPIVEAASWRLTAEITRRYPNRFSVIETHPAGGTYDCITLLDRNEQSNLSSIDLNRVGSVWVHRKDQEHWTWRGSWAELTVADDPLPLLNRLCQKAGLPDMAHVPRSTPAVVAYRVMAAFLGHTIFGRVRWEWRNGYFDTSGGFGGGRRHELFERFPAARDRLEISKSDDVLGESAYRFWFLLRMEEPHLAIEPVSGISWDSLGRTTDLFARYRQTRRIWPALWDMAGHLMP